MNSIKRITHTAIKRKEIGSSVDTWTDLESVIQNEERQKQISYSNPYMWNLEKWYRWSYLQSENRDTDVNSTRCSVKVAQPRPTLCNLMDYTQSLEFSKPESGVGSLSLLQGLFPTQALNPGLLHCRQTLYHIAGWATREAQLSALRGPEWEGNPKEGIHIYIYICVCGWLTLLYSRN